MSHPLDYAPPRHIDAPPDVRTFTGIDGCRAGWLAVHLQGDSSARAELIPAGTLATWLQAEGLCCLVLVDIPIGLTDAAWIAGRNGDSSRGCEREARRRLGPRRASVFNPPCRAATLADAGCESETNQGEIGKKLSRQSLGILPRIREMDAALHDSRFLRSRVTVWEAHPELAFLTLNDGFPLAEPKRTSKGQVLRLNLLSRVFPATRGFVKESLQDYPRKAVAQDDIVDALALAVSARFAYPDAFAALPALPESDCRSLPMQMVYWARRSRSATIPLNAQPRTPK
jgi:predicted RNase H-like nuclease